MIYPQLAQYNFDSVIDLNQILSAPYNRLYKTLKPLWKEVFAPNDRIVLTFNGDVPVSLVNHLQRIVTHIDISNCFILLLTNDATVNDKLTQAAKEFYYGDDVIQTLLVEFDTVPTVVNSPTNFDLPKTLCAAPWAKIEIREDGQSSPCCAIDFKFAKASPNIRTSSLTEIYNAPELKKLREELLVGKKPASCNVCWANEDLGIKSIREHIWWEINDDRYNINWHDETVNNVTSLALALGNVCNLKCRVCNENSSSSWATEKVIELPVNLRKSSQVYLKLKDKSWISQNTEFWDEIKSLLPMLHELRFTGGEPMLIEQHFKFIEYVSTTEYAKDIILRYTTNGTIFPEAAVNIWKKFKSVEISLSIDDIGARFEYQRYGSRWTVVDANIKKYLELGTKYSFVIKINCTISNQNVFYLPEICSYFEQIDVDYYRLNMLYYPSEFSILSIPTPAKALVLDRLMNYNFPKKLKEDLDGIVQAISNAKANDGSKLIETLKKIDLRRNQSFATDHKEMATLIGYL